MHRFLAFVLCAAVLVLCASSPASASDPKRVLILHSYHPGYQWTDDESRGILSVLQSSEPHPKIYVEYMGSKWANDPQYLQQLRRLFKLKYDTVHFDAIVATDNDAVDFLRSYRDEIFGPVPTVFAGFNYLTPQDLAGTSLFTGVSETIDFKGNLDLILRLHPDTKQVALITDTSTTGKRIHREFSQAMPAYANRLQFVFLEDVTIGELLDRVANLPPDTVILYTFFFRDKAGEVFDYDESAGVISRTAKVPIYGSWDFNLGHGIIGGKLTRGFEQGRIAGGMAARVLKGESIANIPVVWNSPSEYMFDFQQLRRFRIKSEDLPKDSTVINRPPSYYAINRRLVWGVVVSVGLLTVVVAFLLANILRRRRAEAALLESKEYLSNVIDFLPDGTFVIDKDRKVIAWNRAMQEISGVHKEDIVGRDFSIALALHGESSLIDLLGVENPESHGRYKNLQTQGAAIMGEFYLPSAFNNRGAYLWAIASPLLNSEGKVVGAIESVRDITDRQQAELDLLNMQEQLRQAAKMEAVGRLAGGIAHDFNNQLTVVQGYCQLLLNTLQPESPERQSVVEVMRAAERSCQLTSQLLAFSRKQILHPKTIDLVEVISNLRDPLSRMIGENVNVEVDAISGLWPVDLDQNQLEQAIMNLAINARDAMPEGGTLSISLRNILLEPEYVLAHADASPGAHIVVTVRDSGSGIGSDLREKIFEPFFTTKGVGKGTGLGLAMVYGFVKQSGGHLDVTSELGQGASFNLYFPRSANAVLGETSRAEAAPRGHETILVVEDDDALRELVVHVLETGGYNVLHAADGAAGIALNREYQSQIDLMLCDVVMPGLSGPETVKQIKLDRPNLKVVFVTGYTDKPIPEEPSIYLLSKPFTPDTLFRFIRQILDEDRKDIEACA